MAVQISVQGFQARPRLPAPMTQFVSPTSASGSMSSSLSSSNLPVTLAAQRLPPPNTSVVPGIGPPSKSQAAAAASAAAAAAVGPANAALGLSFDGRRMRSKTATRRTVDYNASLVNYVQNRVWQRDSRDMRCLQPDVLYNHLIVPPVMLLNHPVNCVATRSVRTATNKLKCPIFCTCWTPEGRRLVTGASSGEFTLWNGLTFSFETILQAHDTSVRSMVWSHNDQWMLTADHGGFVKYWQSNMNNVKMYQAHKDPVRGLSFCPTDQKFASCSDDGTVRIWDFLRCHEEKILRGHGADVKCVDWHPHKSLVASGSKDTQQPVKLWDPRMGASLATIHAHKHTVMDLKWNKNGNWLLTASRDHLLKLLDIRNMKEEVQTFRGHKKEATTLSWHPVHECLFASGGSDGAIMFWLSDSEKEIGSIDEAHEGMVWSLSWHPLGHILVSGSNDHTTKFWTRNRLGDAMRDRYNLNTLPHGVGEDMLDDLLDHNTLMPTVPGLGLESMATEVHKKHADDAAVPPGLGEAESGPAIPGLDFTSDKFGEGNGSAGGTAESRSLALRRKPIYTKPVPKAFERAWTEGRQPGATGPGNGPPHESVGLLGDEPADDGEFEPQTPPFHPGHGPQGPSNRWPGPGAPQRPPGPGGFRGPPDHPRPSGPLLGRPPGPNRGPPRPSGPRPLLPLPDIHPQDNWQSGGEWPDEGPYNGPPEDREFYGDNGEYGEPPQTHGDIDYREQPGGFNDFDHSAPRGDDDGQYGRWRMPPSGSEFDPDAGPGPDTDWSLGPHASSGMPKPPSLLDLKVVPPLLGGGGIKRKWDPNSGPMDNVDYDRPLEDETGNQFCAPPEKMNRNPSDDDRPDAMMGGMPGRGAFSRGGPVPRGAPRLRGSPGPRGGNMPNGPPSLGTRGAPRGGSRGFLPRGMRGR